MITELRLNPYIDPLVGPPPSWRDDFHHGPEPEYAVMVADGWRHPGMVMVTAEVTSGPSDEAPRRPTLHDVLVGQVVNRPA